MPSTIDTVVVGAGQAGLAVSYHLTRLGREHVVLERGRVGETWRTQRWDGFALNTPNWTLRLPGFEYGGPEPDAFAPLAEMIGYLERYAASFEAPVRENVRVESLRRENGVYVVETAGDTLEARNVVLATGAFQQAAPAAPGAETAPVEQLVTSAYRRPEQLPAGAVLVVGGGQSGCQIADELIDAGRVVFLASGSCPWFPRRYRGRDIVRWAFDLGLMDETVDTLPSPAARLACNPPVSGNDGGHDCHPRWLDRRGATLLGRVERIEGSRVALRPGLGEALAAGDRFVQELLSAVDGVVAAAKLDVPDPDPPDMGGPPVEEIAEIDLARAGISTILWATGFRPDYSWVELPLADDYGWPLQQRGVTSYPGLYVVGLQWLHKRKSALLCGVGEDAEYVAKHLAAR